MDFLVVALNTIHLVQNLLYKNELLPGSFYRCRSMWNYLFSQ